MLIPPFTGVGLQAYNKAGEDITDTLFAPNKFMRVDADYTPKPYAEWKAADWPKTYQSPYYPNLFAVGIAFAPAAPDFRPPDERQRHPHLADSSADRNAFGSHGSSSGSQHHRHDRPRSQEADTHGIHGLDGSSVRCLRRRGALHWHGSRDDHVSRWSPTTSASRRPAEISQETYGEIGLAAHWIKHTLHFVFIYKAKARPGWSLLPE